MTQNELNDGLIWASGNGYLELVRLLLERGADVHAYNDLALRWASRMGHLDIVKLLLERGANVHANGGSALKWLRRMVI